MLSLIATNIFPKDIQDGHQCFDRMRDHPPMLISSRMPKLAETLTIDNKRFIGETADAVGIPFPISWKIFCKFAKNGKRCMRADKKKLMNLAGELKRAKTGGTFMLFLVLLLVVGF
jgi:hypothetical protein